MGIKNIKSVGAINFLLETEPAVRYLFEGLAKFEVRKWLLHKTDDTERLVHEELGNNVPELIKNVDAILEEIHEYIGLFPARSVLGGSIIQIAFIGIRQFVDISRGDRSIANEYRIDMYSPLVKYCVGRMVDGIPLGLLIYTARTHFNHFREGSLNETAELVLKKLRFAREMSTLGVDKKFYSAEEPLGSYFIMADRMGWKNYEDYDSDMRAILLV